MHKGVHIAVDGVQKAVDRWTEQIRKLAIQYHLEGTLFVHTTGEIEITIFGRKELIDTFIDELHQCSGSDTALQVAIEPAKKDKDYRGVFRVIQ